MKIKHYDPNLNEWVIDGASNASNLELTNPGYLDEKGESVSIDNGFTKVDNRLSKLEQNLAWIYLNGAKGGGGGSGGGGSADYFIDLTYQPNKVYTTTGTVSLDLLINSGGLSKNFKISVVGSDNVKYVENLTQRSMSRFKLDISGITENVTLEISAVDTQGIAAVPAYVDVIVGALYLDINGNPAKTLMIGGTSPANITFNITNKTGQSASFLLFESESKDPYANDETPIRTQTVKLTQQSLLFNLREICTELCGGALIPGKTFKFKAVAVQTTLGLVTPYRTHNVTIVNSNTLLIVTDGITTDPSSTLSEFVQSGFVQFSYFFSFNSTKYSDFAYKYEVYRVDSNGETLADSGGQPSGITSNVTYSFGYNTSKLYVTNPGEYYKLVMTGYATSDPTMQDKDAVYVQNMYFAVTEADDSVMKARNYNNNLLAYFGSFTFPSSTTGTWKYDLPAEGDPMEYLGIYKDTFKNGVDMITYKVDGQSSGFMTDNNSVRYVGLANGSYAEIPAFKQLLPAYSQDMLHETMFSTGFCISTTFKAEDSVDDTETVLSLGKYENDDLASGFEITLNQARMKIKGTAESTVALPKGELLTVDLNVNPATIVTDTSSYEVYYFTIYVNGVMSACSRVFKDSIDWLFGTSLFLGCRNDLTHQSICNIYDFKIYTAPQSDVTLVQNYISATEQAKLIKGAVDSSLDAELKMANFFIGEKEDGFGKGPCALWDYSNETYYQGKALYNTLKYYVEQGDINYPIVYLQETSISSSFESDCGAVWGEGDSNILNNQHPVVIDITNSYGTCRIEKPLSVGDVSKGPRVAIQGTSSLSYMSKNLELYMGSMDEQGTPMLVSIQDSWLPENEYTLKADVVDSGHVNNVAIGKIVNETTGLLEKTPPMEAEALWTEEGISKERAQSIMGRIKHTSDGFPCLVFVQFASGNVAFQGIYNFNLGRYAYYNLGLKILLDYETPDGVVTGAPFVVSSYKEKINGYSGGTYSLEIGRHNDRKEEAFQQADENTVRWMADCRYTSSTEDAAYKAVTENLYTQLAEMTSDNVQKMHRTGVTATDTYVPIPNEYWGTNYSQWYTYDECGKRLNYNNAMAYYVIAMIFGMVDSMCKNLTLRSWGGERWWTCFYDMDTAFKMDNSGSEVVKYWAHFHKFYNIMTGGQTNAGDAQNSEYQATGIDRWSSERSEDFYQYYASTWSRLWEVLEMLPMRNSEDGNSIGKTYWKLRTSVFLNPREFIEKYYKSYVKQCGPILYNYDYSIKYITISKKYVNGQLIDTTESNQSSFLHGTRVDAVMDWFIKRIYFLDSVYSGDKPTTNENPAISQIESPLNSWWNQNKAGSKDESDNSTAIVNVKIGAKSKIKYAYNLGNQGDIYAWIDETPRELSVSIPNGEKTVLFYGNKYITDFINFKKYNWTQLRTIDFPELIELDLSGSTLKDPLFSDQSNAAYTNGVGLKNIKILNLSNLSITGSTNLTIDVTGCSRLEELNLSNSSYTNFKLPTSGSLKKLDLSGTAIVNLGTLYEGSTNIGEPFGNQASLETINLNNCNQLETIYIYNCESLKNITIPASVKRVWIVNCNNFEEFNCSYSGGSNVFSNLKEIHLENCPRLKRFSIIGQNNPDLQVSLLGCTGIEHIDVSMTSLLPNTFILPEYFTTLKSLNISRTNLEYLQYGVINTSTYLDLSMFPDLENIQAVECSKIKKIACCNNKENPIELVSNSFEGCSDLTELYGNFIITGEKVFYSCGNLKLNLDRTKDFTEGTNVTNISFQEGLLSGYNTFYGCSSLDIEAFRYLMNRLPSSLVTMESMFSGCGGIVGEINRGLLNKCSKLDTLKDAFAGTKLFGAIESRTSNYSLEDKSTWGFFDYVPNLTSLERAFSGTDVEYIDEKVFEPILDTLVNIDYCFSNCFNLKTVKDSNAIIKEVSEFSTRTFFTSLTKLVNHMGYPVDVFSGCQYVRMKVDTDANGNTYLFHTLKASDSTVVLGDSLYAGVTLVGEIGENTFGGITKTLEGEYSIPKFSTINAPFGRCNGNELKIKLSEVGNIFQKQDRLRMLSYVFKGVTCEPGYDSIPNNLLYNCSLLTNINGLFSGMEITNGGRIYQFPNSNLFKDCVSLQDISSLFEGQTHLKISLLGEGFKNCKLQNVSRAFANSGVIGYIPYRLWFMETSNGKISNTITQMSETFADCVCLGYDGQRQINEEIPIGEDSKGNIVYLNWKFGVPKIEGSPLNYQRSQPAFKTKNYNVNTTKYINNPDYVEGGEQPQQLLNPLYNPHETEYDIWQMDGRAWSKPVDLDDDIWSIWEDNYFKYDRQQAEAISIRNSQVIKYSEPSYQNYIVPCDYFRYCASNCNLSKALFGINRKAPVLVYDASTGYYTIDGTQDSGEYYGLVGRIPAKIFEALKDNTKIEDVFSNVNVCAFVNLIYKVQESNVTYNRGIKFPPDLFKNNNALTSTSNAFSGMKFEVGVDINPDLFKNNLNLQNIQTMFANCYFDARRYLSDPEGTVNQIPCETLFINNQFITNASGLFKSSLQTTIPQGPIVMDKSLFTKQFEMQNISQMFQNCASMSGTVPVFSQSTHPNLLSHSGYLDNCIKESIHNWQDVSWLVPNQWLE